MRFAEWMRAAPLTVDQAAVALGVHRVTMHRYLSGRAMPRPAVAVRIEDMTGGKVTVADLHAAYRERAR